MSIFSSIKSGLGKVYDTVKSAFSGGSQTANALQGTYVKPNTPINKAVETAMIQGGNNMTKYTPTFSTPVPGSTGYQQLATGLAGAIAANSIQQSQQLPVNISANSYGGRSSSQSSSLISPETTRTIQNSTLSSSALGSGTLSGGVSTGTSPSAGVGSTNIAKIDNTKMAGAVAGYYKVNDKGQLEPADDANNLQNQKDKTAETAASSYDKYFQEKGNIYNDSEVVKAINDRNIIKQALLAPTAELNAIMAKQTQDLLQLRQTGAKEGVTEAVYGQQENAVNYAAAIRALPIQANIAALQGQLGLAQDYLKELTTMKTDEINRQYEYNKGRFEAISGALETADKRAYEEKVRENDRQYKEQLDLENYKAEIMQSALQNGASQFELNRINTATDKVAVIKAAGKYAVNNKVSGGGVLATLPTGLTPEQASDPFIQKMANTAGGKPLTDTFAQQLNKGLTVLGQIGTLQTNVKDMKTGPIIGAFRGANPWDKNAQTIKAQLNAVVPNLARGVYGEVGVLTDNDIKNYSKTLPTLKSTEEIRNAVLGITVDLIGKSLKRNLEVNAANGKDVSGFIDIYTEMQNTKESIFAQIPGYKGTQSQSKSTGQTVKSNGQDYVVGQVYNDGTANWVVDAQGNWSKQ